MANNPQWHEEAGQWVLRDDEGKPLRGIVRRRSRIGEGGGPIKYGASGEGHGGDETLDEAKAAAVASLVEPL